MLDTAKLDKILANTGDLCLKRRAKEIVLVLDPRPGDKVLDAGCGDGFYLHLLSRLCKSVLIGLDDNPKALTLARHYLGNLGNRKIKLVKGDVMRLPFATGSIDKIVCSEVLEHLPDDVGCLEEFKRVLKPGGVIAITVPNHNYPFLWDPLNWMLERLFHTHIKDGFWAGVWNQHLRLYTHLHLKTAIKKAGLVTVRTGVLTAFGLPFNHFLLNIGYGLRKSQFLPAAVTSSLNKFSVSPPPGLYQYLLKLVNWLDQANDRKFSLSTPTVGIMAVVVKK